MSTSTPENSAADYHQYRRLCCTDCGHVVDVPVYCRDRFCNVCSRPRRNRVRARIENILKLTPRSKGYGWKHLTLTMKSQRDPSSMLDDLQDSFRRLRQRFAWKDHVIGGMAVFEITTNDGYWHVHLHCLVYARFWQQRLISKAWKATSGSVIVYIQAVTGAGVAGYLTKYLTKMDVPDEARKVVSSALRDRRLFMTFGHAHKIKYVKPDDIGRCERCKGRSWYPLDLLPQLFAHGTCDP